MTSPAWYARGPQGPGVTASTSAPSSAPLGGIAGALHVNTSNGDLHRWDGARWSVAGNIMGPTGAPGVNAALQIGEVGTGAPGSAAEARITGSAPEQSLSLTIPAGSEGPPGSGLQLDGQVDDYASLPASVSDGQQWGVTEDAQIYVRIGGAWPAKGKGQPTGGTVFDGQITTAKLDDGSVTTSKIADRQVTADKIAEGVIPDASGKLDKNTTGAYRLYGTAAAGTQTTYPVEQSASASTVPIRDGNGALAVGTPTAAGHAATKAYVDANAGGSETQVFHNIGVAADATISATNTSFTPIAGGTASKWQRGAGSSSMTIGTAGAATLNRKAFWAETTQAWYGVTNLGVRPVRGRGVFSLAQNGGSSTADGTFCMAVLNMDPNMPNPDATNLKMGTHFRADRSTWAYGIWENNKETVLLQGTHTLAFNTAYAIAFQIVGNTVHFRLPSGEIKSATDARVAANSSSWCFAESYCPGGNSDLVPVYEWEFGTGVRWDRLSAPAV